MGVPYFREVSQISCQLKHHHPNPPMGNDNKHGQSSITMDSTVSDIKITGTLRKIRNTHGCLIFKRHPCEFSEGTPELGGSDLGQRRKGERNIIGFHQHSHTCNQRVISEVISNDVNHVPKFKLRWHFTINNHRISICWPFLYMLIVVP